MNKILPLVKIEVTEDNYKVIILKMMKYARQYKYNEWYKSIDLHGNDKTVSFPGIKLVKHIRYSKRLKRFVKYPRFIISNTALYVSEHRLKKHTVLPYADHLLIWINKDVFSAMTVCKGDHIRFLPFGMGFIIYSIETDDKLPNYSYLQIHKFIRIPFKKIDLKKEIEIRRKVEEGIGDNIPEPIPYEEYSDEEYWGDYCDE